MLDIHTHLYWTSYDADRDEVVRRAREAGVKKMICVGTSPEDNPKAIAAAEKYDNVFASVGIHPHFFNGSVIPIEELKRFAKHPKVIAIGECGLDYFSRDPQKIITIEQRELQKTGFIAQLKLAEELKWPLIIHTRPSLGSMNAYQDVFEILKAKESKKLTKLQAILHCYQGDMEITKKFLELPNVYFSFAGNITYPIKKSVAGTKDDLQETVKLVPLDRLFVETDSPFLTPEGKRSERNEPAYIQITARQVCALKGIEMATLETALDKNFKRVFGC